MWKGSLNQYYNETPKGFDAMVGKCAPIFLKKIIVISFRESLFVLFFFLNRVKSRCDFKTILVISIGAAVGY